MSAHAPRRGAPETVQLSIDFEVPAQSGRKKRRRREGQGDKVAFARITLSAATLACDARADVMLRRGEGVICPVCDQLAKIYTRRITAQMARALILLYRHVGASDEWIHAPSFFTSKRANSSNDAALLRHWRLIELQGALRRDGSNRSGLWRITERGRQFVRGDLSVPKFVYLYDAELIGEDDSVLVTVRDALGKKFDYAEIMRTAPLPGEGEVEVR
jgi:hypothetical protein